ALEDALADRPAEAQRGIEGIARESLNDHKQFLFDVLQALLPVVRAAPDARPALGAEALTQLRRAAAAYRWLSRQPERLRVLDRAMWWLVRRCGGVRTRLRAVSLHFEV